MILNTWPQKGLISHNLKSFFEVTKVPESEASGPRWLSFSLNLDIFFITSSRNWWIKSFWLFNRRTCPSKCFTQWFCVLSWTKSKFCAFWISCRKLGSTYKLGSYSCENREPYLSDISWGVEVALKTISLISSTLWAFWAKIAQTSVHNW